MTHPDCFLQYLRPVTLGCVRARGAYSDASQTAWQTLFDWAEREGLRYASGQTGYGLLHDDARIVPAEHCRYDAGIELLPSWEAAARGTLAMRTTSGGVHLSVHHVGPYSGLNAAVQTLRRDPSLGVDLTVDEGRPLIVTYLDDPRAISENALRAIVHLPVRRLTELGRQAA